MLNQTLKRVLNFSLAEILVLTSLSLTPAQTFAADESKSLVTALELQQYFNQLKSFKTGIELSELYSMTKDKLSVDMQFEIESLLTRQPGLKLPPANFKKVKNGVFTDLEISFHDGRETATILLSMRDHKVGVLTYTQGAKTKKVEMRARDLAHPQDFLASLYGNGVPQTRRLGVGGLLQMGQVLSLNEANRNRYLSNVREVMDAAEKLQMKFKGVKAVRRATKTSDYWVRSYLLAGIDQAQAAVEVTTDAPPAAAPASKEPERLSLFPVAADGKACVINAFPSTFKSGLCQMPAEAFDARHSCNSCNTLFYGPDAPCSEGPGPKYPGLSSHEICVKKMSDAGNTLNGWSKWVSKKLSPECAAGKACAELPSILGTDVDAETLKKRIEVTQKTLLSLVAACDNADISQYKECKDLREKLDALNVELCKYKEANKAVLNLSCYAKADAPKADDKVAPTATGRGEVAGPIKVPAGIVISNGPANIISQVANPFGRAEISSGNPPPPSAPKQGRDQATPEVYEKPSACANLAQAEDEVDCSPGRVRATSCVEQGQRYSYFFCDCAGSEPIYRQSSKPIGCEASYDSGRDSSGYGRYGSTRERYRRPKTEKSFWESNGGTKGFLAGMGSLVLGLGVIGAGYYSQQQQWERQYQMLAPGQLKVAPPPTGGVPGATGGVSGTR